MKTAVLIAFNDPKQLKRTKEKWMRHKRMKCFKTDCPKPIKIVKLPQNDSERFDNDAVKAQQLARNQNTRIIQKMIYYAVFKK